MDFVRDKSFKFLPHQLSMVVYWTTMALTGNGVPMTCLLENDPAS